MQHSPNFLRLVDEARPRVREIAIDQARVRLATYPPPILLDVREDSEWAAGHATGAVHLGRGVLERDLERLYPNYDAEIIMYCGGGYRSILACDAAQGMGYRNVWSLIGGYKDLVANRWPIER